jgi:hypothetical protein
MADPVAVAVIVAIVATLAAEGIKVMIARSSCMVKCDPSTRESDDEEYVDEGASGFIGALLTGREVVVKTSVGVGEGIGWESDGGAEDGYALTLQTLFTT